MLLTVVGVLCFLLEIFWNKVFKEKTRSKMNSSRGSFALLGFFLIFFGVLVPISGMEEPELVNTQKLYQLKTTTDFDEIDTEKYLLAEISSDGVRYTYCVDNNGFYDVQILYNVKVTPIENEQPIIEEYVLRPKKTLLTLALLDTKQTEYIIKVPTDKVEFKFME